MNNIQTETNINLQLTVNETNVVLTALRELPHRVVADLIANIMGQAQRQVQQTTSQSTEVVPAPQ
jgi:hypothetical protein